MGIFIDKGSEMMYSEIMKNGMISRDEYLNKLLAWKDKKVIKVVTGIRRCGKSTLFELYKDRLKECGVKDERIVSVNFEDLAFESLTDYHALYDHLIARLSEGETTYVFLDEVQKVDGFEKAVDSLFLKDNVDIYVTGSNSYLLSGELATYLTGRYVEIKMLPLGFGEFCEVSKGERDEMFAKYLTTGGFPYVASNAVDAEIADAYLEGIYNTVIVKDIEERQSRKASVDDKRNVSDLTLLKNIARFMAANVGNYVSVKKIADYITSSGRKISQNTVAGYVDALVDAYVFYRAERFDLSGKQLLKNNSKYYIVDLGLRRHLIAKKEFDLGFLLENIVYFELVRRGYSVWVGKLGTLEVDFVAQKSGVFEYFQVTASMTDKTTFDREMSPFGKIDDNFAKTVLTLDRFSQGNYGGIQVKNLVDWLLDK